MTVLAKKSQHLKSNINIEGSNETKSNQIQLTEDTVGMFSEKFSQKGGDANQKLNSYRALNTKFENLAI